MSTQTDRVIAVLVAILYVVGLIFVVPFGNESMTAYYIALGTVIVFPLISYLIARVSDVRDIKNKLATIEHNTNGRLTDRLEQQTAAIVSQVSKDSASLENTSDKMLDSLYYPAGPDYQPADTDYTKTLSPQNGE